MNKRQGRYSIVLIRSFPNCLNYEILLVELGNNPRDIVLLDDLKLKGLVDMSRHQLCISERHKVT